MSRATKPRKSAAFEGLAPCPTRAMIGPWFTGSSPGLDGLKAEPGFGVDRRELSELLPRHDVLAAARGPWSGWHCRRPAAALPPTGPGRLRSGGPRVGGMC